MSTAQDAVWSGSMPQEYDDGLGDVLFRPPARHTAERLAALLPGGGRVLELAAGTGIVTAELVRLPGVEVTATDLNPGMVAYGAARVPAATWRAADALALDEADGAYDAVVCQFGVMFFPDRVRGMAEARRVLRPGGVLVVTSWDAVRDSNDVTRALVEALEEVLPDDPPDFPVRVPHGYCDPARLAADLQAAGLRDVEVRVVERTGGARSADVLARGFTRGTPLRAELAARGDLDALQAALAGALRRRLGDGPVSGRLRWLEAVAGAPGD